jgi:hypothetical protein
MKPKSVDVISVYEFDNEEQYNKQNEVMKETGWEVIYDGIDLKDVTGCNGIWTVEYSKKLF